SEYEFPTIIQVKIDKLYQDLPCTRFLNSIVEKNYLFVEDYKYQRLEMYNLQSMDLELTFHEISLPKKTSGNPIFSISKYGNLLAYYSGTNCISIHLMENGLKVATKEFTDAFKVLSISFINNDERLFVVTEEDSEKVTDEVTINIWDLFTFKCDVHKIVDHLNIFSSLQKSNCHSVAFSNEFILAFLPDTDRFIHAYSPDKLIRLKDTINQAQKNYSKTDDFKVIKEFNVKKEPWVHKRKNISISYLDEEKTIQLIIGETTVQVWRESSINKQVLDYIWMNQEKFTTVSLKKDVFKREFYLSLSWTDNKNQEHNEYMIHWPNEAHVLKDACVAMEYLYKRRDEPVGTKNLSKYKGLVASTERLIKTCIKNNPDLWSLSEVRYGIMANIIRSKSIPLLNKILFHYQEAVGIKQDKMGVISYLHIPREYEWPMKMIESYSKSAKTIESNSKESDLMLAINNTSDGCRRDIVIVAMLLEYYSNNAEKNTGWMFTVTKALPSLNNRTFETYLKELLYKPCFGSKEEYVDSKFVNQSKLKNGYRSEICSLNVRPRLLLLNQNTSFMSSLWNTFKSNINWRSKETDEEISQVTTLRVVPLPDFTIYPTNATDKTYRKNTSRNVYELYDNPAMEACIDFKWEAARAHFLRQLLIFIVFSTTFALNTGIIINDHAISYYSSLILSFYLGYYLLAMEIAQLYHERMKYFGIYNFLDLASIMLALITIMNTYFLNIGDEDVNQNKEIIIPQAFAVLLLWFEFVSRTATYINMILNILKAIYPFLIFMLIVVIAFGHAMHILLEKPTLLALIPNGNAYNITSSSIPDFENTKIEQLFELDKPIENYYSSFLSSVMGVYFWILGRWDQLEEWDFWPIHVISIGASILMVIIMQNLLIAFMTGVYENAKNNVKLAVIGYRADLIADYETLEKPFGSYRGNRRYIYYVGSSKYQEEWMAKAEEYRSTHKSILSELSNLDDSDDEDVTNEELDEKLFKIQNELASIKELLLSNKDK
ncbi:10646_t:CDS:2, partial [Funneliformis geosporum]